MPQPKKPEDEKPAAEEIGTGKLPPKSEVAEADEPTFTVERLLREGDRILDAPLSAVAGAFSGQPPTREITLSGAKLRVDQWSGAEVHIEPTPQDAANL